MTDRRENQAETRGAAVGAGPEPSLYEAIGGAAAIQAALDRFYTKVLADPRLRPFFAGRNVDRIKERQRSFLAMAFGGPAAYEGRDLRSAHRRAVQQGLDDTVYEVFMGHFRQTLVELDVPDAKVRQIMDIADTGRNDVLNR